MEKKKDVKRIYTGIALVLWVVVSLIGTFFYKEFGGALGDSRIFLWLYAPVLLLATRFGEFQPGKIHRPLGAGLCDLRDRRGCLYRAAAWL